MGSCRQAASWVAGQSVRQGFLVKALQEWGCKAHSLLLVSMLMLSGCASVMLEALLLLPPFAAAYAQRAA